MVRTIRSVRRSWPVAAVLMAAVSCGVPLTDRAAERVQQHPDHRPVHGELTIRRDEYGVPHVYAGSTYGVFFGFGYALAEDHLFQMDMMRRSATGTVAEVLGAKYVDSDRIARAAYSRASLSDQYQSLDAEDRAIFDGYAAGFNARIREVLAARDRLLPREYLEFGFEPSAWSVVDVLSVYEHSMALRYSDANQELGNLALLSELERRYGHDKAWTLFEQLRWRSDPRAPTTIAAADERSIASGASSGSAGPRTGRPRYLADLSSRAASENRRNELALRGATGPDSSPHASNVWIVSPGRTSDGSAVLVNGPQMGDFTPGYIWAVGLHGPGYDIVGSGPLGSPWLIFGTNGKIGWGSTAGMGDTVDIYQESLHPTDAHRYRFRGRYLTMKRRTEVIRVRGAAPVSLDVYSTIHGPVLQFDSLQHTAFSRKRSWDGSEVRSLVAWIHSMRAVDFTQWRAAIADVALTINNYYVDAHGNIGYTFLGRFPRRPARQDPRLPASGAGDMEWDGYLPFESNPAVENPTQGYIANWNNKPQPHYGSSDYMYWSAVDHLNEIDALLGGPATLSVSRIWDVNRRLAYLDDNARYFLPMIQEAARSWPDGSIARRASTLLSGWDSTTVDLATGNTTPPGYLLFRTFLETLIKDVLGPHVPSTVYSSNGTPDDDFAEPTVSPYFPTMGTKIVYNALAGAAAGVPQEFDLLAGRPRAEVLRQALEKAYAQLEAKYPGASLQGWVEAAQPHVFSTLNYAHAPLTTARNELRLPSAMNRGTENNRIVFGPFGLTFCDVSPPGESGFIDPKGTRSPHYADQLGLYERFQCKPQWLERNDVERHTKETKQLTF